MLPQPIVFTDKRRNKRRIKDQILLEINEPIDIVGEKIASVYSNWYWDKKDKKLVSKGFDFSTFLAIAITVGLGMAFLWIVRAYSIEVLVKWYIVSLIFGVFIAGLNESVPIKITTKNGKTRVLIYVFDKDGYRKFDEDEIADILNALGLNYDISD